MLSSGSEFTGREVVNPFSDDFAQKWGFWLQYKKEVHRFEYKHPMSEQAALNELVTLSEGDEEYAWHLINTAIARNWKGLWRVPNPKKNKDGEQTSKKKAAGGTTIDELKVAYSRRNGTEG